MIDRSEIESVQPSPSSLMPDGLLDALNASEVRDLFAYLVHPTQVPLPRADDERPDRPDESLTRWLRTAGRPRGGSLSDQMSPSIEASEPVRGYIFFEKYRRIYSLSAPLLAGAFEFGIV